jgi:ribose transport system permease protein
MAALSDDIQIPDPVGVEAPVPKRKWWTALSFRNASSLYVFAVLFLVFSLWIPDTFLDGGTWRGLLDDSSITALIAVGLVIPLAAGAFNLAVGAEVGFAAILVAWLLQKHGVPVVPAIILTLLAGAGVGLLSGLLVTQVRIDSFIATLGMSSILLACIAWISDGQQILSLGSTFGTLGTNEILGITYPVFVALFVAIAVWYFLERTSTGRRFYATGGNIDAARLAGVKTTQIVVVSFVLCGVIAALAGSLVSARLATGDPTVGPAYLLPAFTAAFLGSTQFRGGRFNVWGTVVAVYVLAVGVKGLQLAGGPVWIPEMFNGVALLIAVGLASYQRSSARTSAIRRLLRRDRKEPQTTQPGTTNAEGAER